MRVPHIDRPVRHDTGRLPCRLIRLPTIWTDIAHHISSRPLPSVTRAGIAASRLETPWRASRRHPGEMDGIGPIDPDPEANTSDRYQTWHQPTAAGVGKPAPVAVFQELDGPAPGGGGMAC